MWRHLVGTACRSGKEGDRSLQSKTQESKSSSFPARTIATFGGNYPARDLLSCPVTIEFPLLIPRLEVHRDGAGCSKCRQRLINNLVCHSCSYTAICYNSLECSGSRKEQIK